MFRFRQLLPLLGALAVPSTQAAPVSQGCVLQTSATLPAYRATQQAQGTFEVWVRCAAATDSYTLSLPGAPLSAAGDATFLAGPAGLNVTLQRAAPFLSGQLLRGDQSRQFALLVPAGQWTTAAGAHHLTINVTISPAVN